MTEQILAERIAAKLRRDILRGKYMPGSSIKERDNAEEMGVSRTPIREAIRILAKEGLLVLRPARSPIVAQPSFKEVSDKIDVLMTLERLSIKRACEFATQEDFDRIRSIHNEITRNYNTLDALDLFELDMSFHIAIVEATHNAALLETYKSYLERLWRARFLSARQKQKRSRVLEEHQALLDALVIRDQDASVTALNDHIGRLSIDIRPVIEEEYNPGAPEG